MTKFTLAFPTTASKISLVQPVSKHLLYLTGTTLIQLEECVTVPVLTASLQLWRLAQGLEMPEEVDIQKLEKRNKRKVDGVSIRQIKNGQFEGWKFIISLGGEEHHLDLHVLQSVIFQFSQGWWSSPPLAGLTYLICSNPT